MTIAGLVVATGLLRLSPVEVIQENRDFLERIASRTLVPYGTEVFRGRKDACSDSIIALEDGTELSRVVNEASRRYSIEPELVFAVIHAESKFDPRARSSKGALGLMQLMPATAEWLGVKDPLRAKDNVFGGSKYLSGLLDQFDGDLELALAAYNAGPATVQRFNRSVPPYRETRNYIRKVMCNYKKLRDRSYTA